MGNETEAPDEISCPFPQKDCTVAHDCPVLHLGKSKDLRLYDFLIAIRMEIPSKLARSHDLVTELTDAMINCEMNKFIYDVFQTNPKMKMDSAAIRYAGKGMKDCLDGTARAVPFSHGGGVKLYSLTEFKSFLSKHRSIEPSREWLKELLTVMSTYGTR